VSSLAASLQALACFGQRHEGGVTRLAWSPELFHAYSWLEGKLRDLDLDVEVDPAGNLLARWDSGSGRPIMLGSHLDTVPGGGHYDGSLGVLGGLHAIALLKEWDIQPKRPIWLAAFMDEEAARFGTSLFGSRAFVGEELAELADRRDTAGVSLEEAMAAAGFNFDHVREARRIDEIGAYLEMHIEQGPILDDRGIDVGVVTNIVGVRGFRARFTGEVNHAGTTPMGMRRDALMGAARSILALREAALEREGVTTNVGIVLVEPGGSNVIPGSVEFTIDARAATDHEFARLEPLVRDMLDRIASEEALEVDVVETFRNDPVRLDDALADILERAAEREGATHLRLPSGAGHDAMVIGRHAPAAMLFVPSHRGVSHSPDEYTSPKQCEVGMRVLARAVETLVTLPA
jgi:hydantoinase/carbamoylase family amidase